MTDSKVQAPLLPPEPGRARRLRDFLLRVASKADEDNIFFMAGAITFNLLVALGIAFTKATLVVLYFMHARYAGGLTALIIGAAAAFYVILVFLTLSDYVTRSWSLTAAG